MHNVHALLEASGGGGGALEFIPFPMMQRGERFEGEFNTFQNI